MLKKLGTLLSNNKKIVIFLLIFTLLCISFTAFIINKPTKTIKDNITPLNKYSTYNENDLEIIEKKVGNEEDYMSYFQISGLKDKNIEDKINKNISDTFQKLSFSEQRGCINLSNFNNVLSYNCYYYDEKTDTNKDLYFNIDLNTGEDIKFDDLFVKNVNFKDFIPKIIYNGLFVSKTLDNMYGYIDKDLDYSEIEDKTIEYLYLFNKKKFDFSVNDIGIDIIIKDDIFEIKYIDNLDKIAVFDRYKSKESLFEKDNIGFKDIYIGTYYSHDSSCDRLGYISDNYYTQIYSSVDSKDETNILNTIIKHDLDLNKPDSLDATVYAADYSLIKVSSNLYNLYVLGSSFKMKKDYFKNTFLDVLLSNLREMKPFIWFADYDTDQLDKKNVSYQSINKDIYIDKYGQIYKTKNANLSDYFDEEYDYKQVIIDLISKENDWFFNEGSAEYYLDKYKIDKQQLLETLYNYLSFNVDFDDYDKQIINVKNKCDKDYCDVMNIPEVINFDIFDKEKVRIYK